MADFVWQSERASAKHGLSVWPVRHEGFVMRGYLVFEIIHDPRRFERARLFVEEGLRAAWLKPIIAKTFPFERIVEAHRYLEANEQIGKVIVTVP
jgi:NADPH:quinone reductase-like Zn-dependent oxidoreductase